jgi:hypothetical protein
MRSFTPIFCTALGLFLLLSCKEENKEEKIFPETVQTEVKIEQPLPNLMYVIAPSGLLLRKEDNLDSEQMGKMPYGASVKVLDRPDNKSITVSGIADHMIQVKYSDITGYAYNGYLTRFKVPQQKETPEHYANRIKEDFPKVSASSGNVEKDKTQNTSTQIVIPAGSWSEAFLIAKQLYDIPAEYNFPGLNGPDKSSLQSRQEHAFSSTLEAERTANTLTSITYTENAKGFSRTVKITQDGDLYTLAENTTKD